MIERRRQRRTRTFLIDTHNPDGSPVTVLVKARSVEGAMQRMRAVETYGQTVKVFGIREIGA